MRKYLELFKEGFPSDMSNRTAIENWPYVGSDVNGDVVYTVVPKSVVYDPYVTFTAEEDNSSIGLNKLSTNQTLEYSMDTTTWNTFDTTTNIPLNNGDKVYVRGVLSANNTNSDYTQFKMSGKIAASGNCNAIWNYQDLNAPLIEQCGYYMFYECTSLTSAPELPATKLAGWCYQYMFYKCTSLTATPELPATELATACYGKMFYGCTSLTTVPKILPATTLADYCYSHMFQSCTSLTTAPELPATELANYCYQYMFHGCTSLTTAPELPATELKPYCYNYMFYRCTSLTTAPELLATKISTFSYAQMFQRCTNLNYIKCLATTKKTQAFVNWVSGVSSTGTFVKHPHPDMTWTTGSSGIPSGWTVVDAEL